MNCCVTRLFSASEEKPSNTTMFAFYLSELDVRAKRTATDGPEGNDGQQTLKEIQEGLQKLKGELEAPLTRQEDNIWNDAYRLERLLALIEPSKNLWVEVKRRIAEAKLENLPSAVRLAAEADAAAPLVLDSTKMPPSLKPGGEGEALLRSMLVDALEELHYSFIKKFYARPIQQQATYKIVFFGMVAFALFLLPYLVLYAWLVSSFQFDWTYWTWLPLYASLTAGLFGALFSRLLYLQSNWDVLSIGGLKDARAVWSICLRGCVGMTGAVIVSFFLQSGVIAGTLFPEFDKIGMEEKLYPASVDNSGAALHPLHIIYPSKSFALLVVWSFLAGFSERLVPSILQETEKKISKNS